MDLFFLYEGGTAYHSQALSEFTSVFLVRSMLLICLVFCFLQSVPKTIWQTSPKHILSICLIKFYAIFTSLYQFILDGGIGLVVFDTDCFVCLRPVSCAQYCLWIVHSWLPVRFSLMFISIDNLMDIYFEDDQYKLYI